MEIPWQILELGAGLGETALAVAASGLQVTAVEESEAAVRFLQREYPIVEWKQEQILPFLRADNGQYDAITLFHVLEHLLDLKETVAALKERISPGGVVVIEVPDAGGGPAKLQRARWKYHIYHHVNYFGVRSLSRLMEEFGFRRLTAQRLYDLASPSGKPFKDTAKAGLAAIGMNSVIRTAWTAL